MTYQDDFTLSAALLEQLSTQGLGALPDLFPVLLNAVMQIERQKHLGAAPHERTEERTGHANGYKDKTLNTRLGQFTVAVPQVREVNGQGGGFYPQSLKRCRHSGTLQRAGQAEGDTLLKRTTQKYGQAGPKLAAWLEESLHEGLTVLAFPEAHRRLLRTTNKVERVPLIKLES